MDASRMVERCKEAQEHMEPECEDTTLLEFLRNQGLRSRPDEAKPTDPIYVLAPEREVRDIRPLDDNPYLDMECYGV